MVFSRINILKILFITFLTILFSILLIKSSSPIETNLAKSILPQNVTQNSKIIPLMEKSASTIKIIFESKDENNLQEIKQAFLADLNPLDYIITNPDFTKLIDWYSSSPTNFLSSKTRNLLIANDFDTVYQNSLERLYNPTGISIVEFNKDPFLLLTDFLLSKNIGKKQKFFDGKYYETENIKINPNSKNFDNAIKVLIKKQKQFSKKGTKIYLAGTPIHTYYTALFSAISINIICIKITGLIIFLTYLYFKRYKLLLPIALSIAFGGLAGFSITKTVFENFHIITFLFGTTLIGIGIDYSYHYLFSEKKDNKFLKDLTLSLLSTVVSFSLLYFLKIDILNQISTFTSVGLIAIYTFILVIYPCINFPTPIRTFSPVLSNKTKKIILTTMTVLTILGLFRIHFDDSLTSLYSPSKKLLKAETLYNQVSETPKLKPYFITVNGANPEILLQNEELVTKVLDNKNIEYISISKFIPSIKQQKENAKLVQMLYAHKLQEYKNILSEKQIDEIYLQKNTPRDFNFKEFPFFEDLLLDKSNSIIIIFASEMPELELDNIEVINFQKTISDYLKNYRIKFLCFLPVIYIFLYLVLTMFYGLKKSTKMLLPIILSAIFVISFISLINIKLNLFNLLGILLVLGFTIDYAIFGQNKSIKNEFAIFLACITTAISFLLLAFTTFKLISTLALTIALGIIFNYILIKIFSDKN